jgi:hypothetical protein
MPDMLIASVINQKAVNKNAQQILVAMACQVITVMECQFGCSTNLDNDAICS